MKTKFALVFAAAAASLTAQAATWTNETITQDQTLSEAVIVNSATQNSGKLTVNAGVNYDQANSKGDYTLNGGEIDVGDGLAFTVRDFVMNGGKITATGSSYTPNEHNSTQPAFGAYNSFVMNAGEVDLSNGGRLWIGTAQKADPSSYGRMALKGGTIKMSGNGLITGNKRVINSTTMEGYVGDEVLAGNTIGFDGVTLTVESGTNTVDALHTELTGGAITVNSGATLEFVTTAATNETDADAETEFAKINSLRMTGGELNVSGTVDASALNASDFIGGSIAMNGGELKTGKNTVLNTTIVNKSSSTIQNGGHIEMTGGIISFDAESSDPALTITGGNFDMTGGTIDLTNGRLSMDADAYMNGGVINATDVSVTTSSASSEGSISFESLKMEGGVINAKTFTVASGSTFTYAVNGGKLNLTGEGSSFTNSGTLALTGLTGHDQGKQLYQLLGISENQLVETGSLDLTQNGNQFITGLTYNAESGLQVTAAESVDDLNDGTLKASKYAAAGLAVAAGAGDIQGDMTAAALMQLGTYTDYLNDFNDSASQALNYVENQIEAASARGLAAYTVASDIQRLINDGVEARNMTSIYQGGGAWANVFYSKNSADTLYGDNAGYESDIYGGQIGFDWAASCGYRLGAALSIGTADSNNTGAGVTDTDIDSDFYGVSIYASKQVERLTFGLDVGYTKVENDLTTRAYGKTFSDSVDASVWTAGLRANVLAWDGDALDITPHVGLRYNYVDMDNMGMVDQDSLNMIEMPVGISFAGNFEAAGWTIAPVLDLSIVPQLGDKDVNLTVQGANSTNFDVLDGSLFRTTLGVEAAYGNFGLGLNYKYGTSSEDRDNHSVNLNAVYRF